MFIHRYYPVVSVIRVLDGDTVNVLLDMGFGVRYDANVRIMGIDAPEKTGTTASIGLLVKECMKKMLGRLIEAKVKMKVRSDELDMYGRVLGDIEFSLNGEDTSLSKQLLKLGIVQSSCNPTGKRPEWTLELLESARICAEDYLKS